MSNSNANSFSDDQIVEEEIAELIVYKLSEYRDKIKKAKLELDKKLKESQECKELIGEINAAFKRK